MLALHKDFPVIALRRVAKVYDSGASSVSALQDADLEIQHGEFAAITGPSGCGKSTLLQIIGCLDRPTSGSYILNGRDISALTNDELAHARLKYIGFVFQSFHLLPRLPVIDNVELPLIYAGVGKAERYERATLALKRVGMEHRLDHRPSQLSGGERQRVAIARALVNDPEVILADEPTGNLDSSRGAEILALFQDLNRAGKTILLVTHDVSIAASTRRIVRLQDGRIIEDAVFAEAPPVA